MSQHVPNWYPDPSGRFEVRYWDGTRWTEHVSTNGVQSVDTPAAPPGPPAAPQIVTSDTPAAQIRQQVRGQGARGAGIDASMTAGMGIGGSLLSEPVLVVNQKAKLIELTNQYAVFDGNGRQIGSVSQVGQSTAKKVLRAVSSLDQFMTHKLEVTDMAGAVQMRITRPRKVMKSTVIVEAPDGGEIGRIVQENMIGKIHFGLESGGQRFGAIRAENWRAWNFRIEDANGNEVARITKTWEGLAKTMFTTADNYVVQIQANLPQPLLALVVASALSVDTALKQDSRGFG
jgi:uncharacterized protein YxjI